VIKLKQRHLELLPEILRALAADIERVKERRS
jgi:hypothetical protein